ncbi:MAG: hypothetical protein VW982_02035 [Candidatus Poseidoniales archaeon]|jgi:hypothetical protein
MSQPNITPWGAIADAADGEPESPAAPSVSQADITGPTPTMMQQITPEMVAAGYQPGMSGQTIVVGGDSKGPKVPLIIAAVLIGFGLLGFIIGAVAGASIEDTLLGLSTEEYTTELGTNGTLVHDDADNAGEEGWYLLIPGDAKADENKNGIIDACEGINFTVLDGNGDDASERVARISCSTDMSDEDSNAYEPYFDIKDHVIVARICNTLPDDMGESEHTCRVGETLTVSNDAGLNMSVVDLDEMFIPVIEELIGVGILSGGSFFAGCCSLCGGLVALVVGLLRFGGGNKQPNVQFQMN